MARHGPWLRFAGLLPALIALYFCGLPLLEKWQWGETPDAWDFGRVVLAGGFIYMSARLTDWLFKASAAARMTFAVPDFTAGEFVGQDLDAPLLIKATDLNGITAQADFTLDAVARRDSRVWAVGRLTAFDQPATIPASAFSKIVDHRSRGIQSDNFPLWLVNRCHGWGPQDQQDFTQL